MSDSTMRRRAAKSKSFTLNDQRGAWVARVVLPDGYRAAMTVGASQGADRVTEERARETMRSYLERGLVDRLMAERATKKRPIVRAFTVADVADKWVTLIEADKALAPATRANHRRHAEGPIVTAFGDVEPSKLTPAMLRGWLRELSHLSASRIRNVFFSLSRMLDDATAEEWIALPVNPCRSREVQKVLPALHVPDEDEVAHHTPLDVKRLLVCDTIPAERATRYVLAFGTGLRDGELAGLRWVDIVDVHGVRCAWVRGAVALIREAGPVARGRTKTRASVRKVPLHPAVLEALERWKADGWRALVGRDPEDQDPVFPDASGSPHRPTDSAPRFREDLAAAGVASTFEGKPFEFRSTRRSFSTALEGVGVDGDSVDRLLGHAKKTVRERNYTAGSTPEMVKRLSDAIARLPFFGGSAEWQHGSEVGTSLADPASETALFGGGEEIRTPGRLSSSAVFKNPRIPGFRRGFSHWCVIRRLACVAGLVCVGQTWSPRDHL